MSAGILRARWLLSALLVAAAAAFVVGVTIERSSDHHDETTAESATHSEATEQAESTHTESSGTEASGAGADVAAGSEDHAVLGLHLERTGFVVGAVVASLALAALVWVRRERWLLFATAAFAAAFAVLDVAELAHQISEHRAGLVIVAVVVALLHAAAVGVAVVTAEH